VNKKEGFSGMASSESSESLQKNGAQTEEHDIVHIDTLRSNVLRFPTIIVLCIAAIAPAASMLFNVPVMASQAGASVPLAFVLSSLSMLLLSVAVLYFARHLSSAAGFSTWVRHGLGKGAAFQAGWLMVGGYALFEAALQATVGGSLNTLLSGVGFHIIGGWVTYAGILTLIVGICSYFALSTSIWIMAPFALLEVLALLLLDAAISLKGGTSGHDVVHTFLPAGAQVKGAAPGGMLGIADAMVLGILAFVGFETAAAYGEEARHPRRTIPLAVISLIIGLALLYTWTAYAATIGVGWQNAGSVLGNVNNAPQQYVALATTFVGSWLGIALVVFVVTSNFASSFAMHQAMVRYCYDMGRTGIFPRLLGRTHPRWKSPHMASIAQSIFSLLVILCLGLIRQHTNADGSILYSVGLADGTFWQQTNGTASFGWLASVVTMMIITVYLLTNIAVPFFARSRQELRPLPHLVAPTLSTLLLLLPLVSYIGPALPGAPGVFFTHLGFAPTPFPSNILPLFVIGWIILGLLYAAYLSRKAPERYEMMGHIVRGE
jgi:amino acid transporter